jgi:hypothetical protein
MLTVKLLVLAVIGWYLVIGTGVVQLASQTTSSMNTRNNTVNSIIAEAK